MGEPLETQAAAEKHAEITLRQYYRLVQAVCDTADRLGIPETDEEYPVSVLAKIEAEVVRLRDQPGTARPVEERKN